MLDRVYNFANFFDTDEVDFVKSQIENHGQWTFEGLSMGSSLYPNENYINHYRVFWYKDLSGNKGLTWLFKDKIEKFLTRSIELYRFYANGQAHGQSGLFHDDVEPDQQGDYGSLIYYIHDNWLPEYGGHLLIKEEDELVSILPETNSAVLFNSRRGHCALEPTVYCKTQRLSIAFKFRIK